MFFFVISAICVGFFLISPIFTYRLFWSHEALFGQWILLFGIYLSIPVLFNYKSIENIIESKFYSDFDIKLNINGDIKYQLLPKPHLLISDSLLSIDEKFKFLI